MAGVPPPGSEVTAVTHAGQVFDGKTEIGDSEPGAFYAFNGIYRIGLRVEDEGVRWARGYGRADELKAAGLLIQSNVED